MHSIPVVVQHRHIHLSKEDFFSLFGQEEMRALSLLRHRGQFVSPYTLTVRVKGRELEDVRVLGPFRETTQVELSPSEAVALGINAPVRVSGDLDHSASCTLVGPHGELAAGSVVIIPARHLHCSPQDAEKLSLEHHDTITLRMSGQGTAIEHVTVRVHPTFSLEFHLSTDEAAAYWLHTGDQVTL